MSSEPVISKNEIYALLERTINIQTKGIGCLIALPFLTACVLTTARIVKQNKELSKEEKLTQAKKIIIEKAEEFKIENPIAAEAIDIFLKHMETWNE